MATTEERFWAKVQKTETCWLWTAGRTVGYGAFWDGKRMTYAHRYSYELLRPIPAGFVIDHDNPQFGCGNPLCVKPQHLEAVPPRENLRRRRGLNSNNKSGARNVVLKNGSWRVQVGRFGSTYYGGRFDNLPDAKRAAAELRKKLFG